MATTNLDDLSNYSLPRLRLISTKIHDDQTPQERSAASRFVNGGENDHGTTTASERDHGEESECHTPTADENKIPRTLNCPPAPRKPTRKSSVSCKRKLFDDEFDQFFEIVNGEEVDEFFRSSFELGARSRMTVKKKKRCMCT